MYDSQIRVHDLLEDSEETPNGSQRQNVSTTLSQAPHGPLRRSSDTHPAPSSLVTASHASAAGKAKSRRTFAERPSPIDYPRRRAAIACERFVGNARQDVMDSNQLAPFARNLMSLARIVAHPRQPPQKSDIARIYETIENIQDLLTRQQQRQPPRKQIDEDEYQPPPDESVFFDILSLKHSERDDSNTPTTYTPNKAVDDNVVDGYYQELGIPSVTFSLGTAPLITIRQSTMAILFRSFFEKVHSWYPFLNRASWIEQHIHTFDDYHIPGLDPTHCMVFMVLALGKLAQDDRLDCHDKEAAEYARHAFAMLPAVTLSNDLAAVHSLILFCLYFMWRLKPGQAWNLVCLAASKIQQMLHCESRVENISKYKSPEQLEHQRRAFWVVYLIEKELRVCYINLGSGLDQYEHKVDLPTGAGMQDIESSPLPMTPANHDLHCRQGFYLLAEITMRRLLKRTQETRKLHPDGADCYDSPLAKALEAEIDGWHQLLPESLRFKKSFPIVDFGMDRPVAPPADDHVAYLRAQYYGCVGGFNWPALESITDANRNHIRPDPSLLLPAKKIIYATLRFIASMSQLMDHRTPNLWTIAQTIGAGGLLLVVAAGCPATADMVPPIGLKYVQFVMHSLQNLAPYSPSIETTLRTLHKEYQDLLAKRKF